MFRHTTQVGVLSLATLLGAFGLQRATDAAQFLMTNNGPIYTFYVDGESLNGGYDTIYFQAKSHVPDAFKNTSFGDLGGEPKPPGLAFTYSSRMVNGDPLDFPGALGLTRVDFINNGQELSYTAGNLNGTVTTASQPNGDLFLANLYVPDPTIFTATVQLISAGTVVFEATQTIPEPFGAIVALTGFSSLLAFRRGFG